MTSILRARASHARSIAFQQRERLLQAVWIDVQDDARSHLRAMLPPNFLPPLARQSDPLEAYSAMCVCCPDGIWRVSRDDVGRHPGAMLLEAPLLTVFLPRLCRLLLGQSLMLPSIPVWWLGDRATASMLANHPARFCLRPAFDPHASPIALADLSVADRSALQRRVALDHNGYVTALNLELQEVRWAQTESDNAFSDVCATLQTELNGSFRDQPA